MTFTGNQGLENQPAGQNDWDTALNANFTIIDRGYHGKLIAGVAINTGDILAVFSGGIAHPYDPNSLDLTNPAALSYKSVSSGETDTFLFHGIVSSMDIFSGNIIPGEPAFVSVDTPGFAVSSYSAAWPQIGLALRNEQLYFSPKDFRERILLTTSLGELQTGSTHAFTVDIGHRGLVNRLDFRSESHDLYTLKFFSGSAGVSSERLFETQSGGITSIFFRDQAGFFYENTDVASPGLIFGTLAVSSSATGVASGFFNFDLLVERWR